MTTVTARVELELPLTINEGNVVRAAAYAINANQWTLDFAEQFFGGLRLALNAETETAPWLVYRGGSHVALIKGGERILFATEERETNAQKADRLRADRFSSDETADILDQPQTPPVAAPQAPQATNAPRKRSKAQGPRDLTSDELQALQVFASTHGRNWKQVLRDGWMVAAYPGDLQVIRNTFGPAWLTTFRLPKAVRS